MKALGGQNWVGGLALAGALAAGCGHGEWTGQTKHEGSVRTREVGSLHPHADRELHFVASRHHGGRAGQVGLVTLSWGRLVDVYDFDADTGLSALRLRDVLVGEHIASDGLDFELEPSLTSRAERLTIRHAFGSLQFATALRRAEAACASIEDRGFDALELPPFSRVPRNAVIAIDFDDLLDPSSVDARSIALVGGEALDEPLAARVWVASSRGDVVNQSFHSTRALVDPRAGGASVGLPGARSVARANVGLRLPTQIDSRGGASVVVRNLGGAALSPLGNGSVDLASRTRDVVRAFRSGGASGATGDPFAGFMADTTPPRLLLDVDCTLTRVASPAGGPVDEFDVLVRFSTDGCAVRRRPGDAIATTAHLAEVLSATTTVTRVRVLQGDPGTFGRTAGAVYTTPWAPFLVSRPVCALRFSPPAGAPPVRQVSANAAIRVRFDEAIDPESMRPFDSFRIARNAALSPLDQYVVGDVLADAALQTFTFQPRLPLSHAQGTAEVYRVELDGARIRDLAGNAMADDPPALDFVLDPAQSTQLNAGIVLRFAGPDEDGDGLAEARGQFLFDLVRETIRPRPVTRFSAPVDATQPTTGAMTPLPGVQILTPLSPYGSKSMQVWRYSDLGFGLREEATHNLDVEGLWWRPSGGQVTPDSFPEFQLSLTHSRYLPDEELGASLLPARPATGLVSSFDANVGSASEDPLTVVHAKASGYSIDPADLALTSSGDVIAPYPLNRGVSPGQFNYWTWRDTAKQVLGGPNGAGADTGRLAQLLGAGAQTGFYAADEVPTIGLPLLTEIRTYPSVASLGVNSFSIAIAINSSSRPFFRAHSTGGVNPLSGQVTIVDPDNAATATGGINPSNGQPTFWGDNVFYFGQADFVVRVSRMHTRWIDTQSSATRFEQPLLDLAGGAPAGTQVVAAFRGASSITAASSAGWLDAQRYDSYGDGYTAAQLAALSLPGSLAFTPQFFPSPADNTWRSSPSDVDGARFVQARLSFLCDPISGVAPVVDSLALAYGR